METMETMETTTTKRNGRPPKKVNEKRTYFYTVRLTPVEKKVLLRESKKLGQSQTEMFHTIFNSFLEART